MIDALIMTKHLLILSILIFASCKKDEITEERKKLGKVEVIQTDSEKCGYSVVIETSK